MRINAVLAVSIAFAACALLCPGFADARGSNNDPTFGPSVSPAVAQRVAARMVPAEAVLDQAIDARKMQPGQQFRVTLRHTVHLKNGFELPRDTMLIGTIATDQMRADGTSTLALRFTEAKLKDGKAVPVQAAIMGVAPPSDAYTWDYSDGGASLSPWDGKTLRIDELGALSGVDFHGSIGSPISGLFVSTKKDEMKLSAGSQISLAIAAKSAKPANGGV